MADQPLAGVRVIDLTHYIAGPYCTKLLADFGADVIKIERPDGGDPARTLGPFPGDVPHPEKSGLFLHVNTSKRSVALDLKTAEGKDLLHKLLASADVLVESFQPGVMAGLGFDPLELERTYPKLIITSISNFGQTGPYRDFKAGEITLFAMGGKMNRNGLGDRYPIMLGGNHVQYQAGNCAAMATMFALFGARFRGIGGQRVDISIFETLLGSYNQRVPGLVAYAYNHERAGRGDQSGGGYPQGFYPCADGYISITGGGAFFNRVANMLGHPEWNDSAMFGPPAGQADLAKREYFVNEIWLPWLLERTREEIVTHAQSHESLCTPMYTVDEVANSAQLAARGYFQEIEHPVAGKLVMMGAPAKPDAPWWQLRRPAPTLGQHTIEVLTQLAGATPEQLAVLEESGVISAGMRTAGA